MTQPASPFAFVDGALDRADHLRDDPAALDALRHDAGVIVLDADGRALADAVDLAHDDLLMLVATNRYTTLFLKQNGYHATDLRLVNHIAH